MVWCVWLIVNNFTCYHHALLLLWIIFLPILCHTMESEHIGCLWKKKLIAPQPSFSPTHLISQISSLLQCGPLDFGCFRGGFRDCNLVAEKELFAPSTSSVLASHRSSPTEGLFLLLTWWCRHLSVQTTILRRGRTRESARIEILAHLNLLSARSLTSSSLGRMTEIFIVITCIGFKYRINPKNPIGHIHHTLYRYLHRRKISQSRRKCRCPLALSLHIDYDKVPSTPMGDTPISPLPLWSFYSCRQSLSLFWRCGEWW